MKKKRTTTDRFLKYLFDTLLVIVPMTILAGLLFSRISGAPMFTSILFLVAAGIVIGLMSVTKNFFKFMKPLVDISAEISRMSSGDLSGKISTTGKGGTGAAVFRFGGKRAGGYRIGNE